MAKVEQVEIDGKVVPGAFKVFRIDPMLVLRSSIEEIDAGVQQLLDRRTELHAQADQIIAETEAIDATLADAAIKRTMHSDALGLVEDAAELAPNLPAGELKPSAAGDDVPPTDSPAAPPSSSSNGGDPLPPQDDDQEPDEDELPPTGGPITDAIEEVAPPPSDEVDEDEDEPPAPKAGTVKSRLIDAFAALPGWRSAAELAEHVGTTPTTIRKALQELVTEKRVQAKGATKSRRYRRSEKSTPVTPAASRKARPSSEDDPGAGKARQEPTDEGRVMAVLQLFRLDLGQLATKVGVPVPKLRPILEKLIGEGDVRVSDGTPPEYYATP